MPKVKRICKRCGKEFLKKKWDVENHNRGHYCSRKCARKQQAENRSKQARTKTNCEYCGKEFSTLKTYLDQGLRKYCSKKCTRLARRNRVDCECGNCGKEFKIIESVTANYRNGVAGLNFCKKECFYAWQRKNRIKEITLICDFCNKKFKRWQHRLKHKEKHWGIYCSNKCKQQSQRVYPSILTHEEYARFRNELYKRSNKYAKMVIRNQYGINHVPESLAEAKLNLLKIHRKLNHIKQ